MSFPKESGIYIFQNTISHKVYIGQSQDIDSRVRMHTYLLNRNQHYNPHLQSAWNKYGEGAFNIAVLELCHLSKLDEREVFYIEKYNSFENGYNRTGGGGGLRGHIHNEESRTKMKNSHHDYSRNNHPQARAIVLLNTGEEFSCILDAAEKYNIAKADISKVAKHQSYSAGSHNGERLVWEYKENYDLLTQEEIDRRIYIAQNCKRGEMCHRAKPVICVSTGEVFGTIRSAAKRYNVSAPLIRDACKGIRIYAAKDPLTGEPLRWAFYINNKPKAS